MKLRSGMIVDPDRWYFVDDIKQLKLGDFVRGSTGTWGQKYLTMFGFEDCNAVYTGKVVKLGNDEFDIVLELSNGQQHKAVEFVGSSGWNSIEIYR